jgi:hypothetical protein
MLAQLYVRVDILFISGKHLHDRIISPRWEVLIPPLFIEVSVLSQESEQSCIMCVSAIDFACFYYFSIRFFRQCGIFYFILFLLLFSLLYSKGVLCHYSFHITFA